MAGWIVFAFFVTLIVLRAVALPEARIFGGIAFMGFGIWLIWEATVPHAAAAFRHMPDMVLLAFGLWLVVRGALRVAS